MKDTEPLHFEQIAPEAVQQAIEKIDQALKDKEVDKKVKQKINYAKKHWPENLKRYEDQQNILGKRNNYSKTDPDVLVADAGYGSEENYEYLVKEQVEGFVKFSYFHLEKQDKFREDPSKQENLYYNAQDDCLYCPMGQKMVNIGTETKYTDNGYERLYTKYQAANCQGCPMRGVCHDQKSNRVISVNHKLRKYKEQARQRLFSELGIIHRKKRPADVEPVFGDIKYNKNFRRFNLRGLSKVEIETGLLAIAHNLAKMLN